MKRAGIWGLGLVVLWGAYFGGHQMWRFAQVLRDPLAISEVQRWELVPGANLQGTLQQWRENNWLEWPWAGDWLLKLGLRLQPKWSRWQAGIYTLEPGQSPLQLARKFRQGEIAHTRLTLIEGQTLAELRQLLERHPDLRDTSSTLSAAELMLAVGYPQRSAEGAFLPETYKVPVGSSSLEVLHIMADALDAAAYRAWSQRHTDLPLEHVQQLITLASIIEKETAVAAERAQVAGVFVRRLRQGMRLQTDPTVIYGLGDAFDGNITRQHLRSDTPWNTYTRHGLPQTPICMPSAAALLAAAQPAAGDSLYFVADGRGGHVFSRTLDEHQRAVRAYLRYQRGG